MFRLVAKPAATGAQLGLSLQKRLITSTARLSQQDSDASLPSSPEMKADVWASPSSDDMAITNKVIGIARYLQEQTEQPISVDKSFTKHFPSLMMYDPFDFTMRKVNMEKQWDKQRGDKYLNYKNGRNDPFERTGIDPLDLYTMPETLSKFLTSTGLVLPREVTGCTAKNQKKLGIAIKRAISVGLLSSTHRHSKYMPRRVL